MSAPKVWFVTGASKGIGFELVQLLLSQGEKVAATSRSIKDLESRITGSKEDFLPLELDITSDEKVKAAVGKVIEVFGRIDVVVNNAGYLLIGSMEEISDAEFRQALDVNLVGATSVIRAALPYLRTQGSGHIINIASGAGYFGSAKAASYNAPKFALIGLSEALAEEVKEFGIKVTVLAPGVFRTNFLDSSSFQLTKNLIEEYQSANMAKGWEQFNGNQPGDPAKLVKIIKEIASIDNPPVHLLLGPDVYEWVKQKRKADDDEFEAWKYLTLSTNFESK